MNIICFGEMLLRLSPTSQGGLEDADSLAIHVAGAEANVAISLASMGNVARMATVLPDDALGERALVTLQRHGVDTSACKRSPGRMGLYFVESPRAGREGGYFYDRASSAFTGNVEGIDWDAALEGAAWLHFSGISVAVGDSVIAALRRALASAQRHGVSISFDCNVRPALWAGRENLAGPLLAEFAHAAHLIFASDRDAGLILGHEATTAELIHAMPEARWIATTTRAMVGGQERLGALLTTRNGTVAIAPVSISPYVDRIGAGDAFAAGLLHALTCDWDDALALRFAHRACLMKHAITGDFSTLTEGEIIAGL